MKKGLTEMVFILDRSGSMGGLEADTVGGFNAMIRKQKGAEGSALVTTVIFNDKVRILHDRMELTQVPLMTERDYSVGGCTALLDAVGGTIHHIAKIHRYSRPEDVPEHTVFVITTDGMENASCQYSAEEVRQMIEKEKTRYGWEFLFLGANIDAVGTAGRLGIGADRAANYNADGEGTRLNYEVLGQALSRLRSSAPLGAEWKRDIDRDFTQRGRGQN